MDSHELTALDSELKNDYHDIGTIEEMRVLVREEIYARISQNERDEILEVLARDLKARLDSVLNNEKTAPHFFEIFQDSARGNPPRAYRNILKEFFLANTEEIIALVPNLEEIKALNQAISSFDISIKILQKTLDTRKSADDFFAILKAVTASHPSDEDKDALKTFLDDNRRKLKKLSLSTEYFEYIDSYMNQTPTAITPLEEGLELAEDADKFFANFKANASIFASKTKRKAWEEIFDDSAETIKKLPFSIEQIKYMNAYAKSPKVMTILLGGALERAARDRDADKFFGVFKTVARIFASEEERRNRKKFFNNNAETIKKLPFSTEQISYINAFVNDPKVTNIFLEEALERAARDRDADKFFGVFRTVARIFASEEERRNRKKFFNNNAETIKKLPFSTEQISYMDAFVNDPKVTNIFLEGALERAGRDRDADKFFGVFKATAWVLASEEERRGRKKFFLENVDAILSLGLSSKQIRYMDRYIDDPSVSAKILKASLKTNKKNCAVHTTTLFL